MPSLIRFLVLVGVLAGVVYAGMWSVATLVQPQQREITRTLPANALSGK